MALPVLIAARNQADSIGETLSALPPHCEPIVLANGCTDDTALIADSYNVRVIECPQEGKLPSIQAGLMFLGKRAMDPLITLDADSKPLVPKHWIPAMRKTRDELPQDHPALVVGGILYGKTDILTAMLRNVTYLRKQMKSQHDNEKGEFPGINTLIHLYDEATLERVLAMPHIWPGEDVAIKDVIVGQGGSTKKSGRPSSFVVSDGRRFPNLIERLKRPAAYHVKQMHASYVAEAAVGSVPYRTPGLPKPNVTV